MYAYGEGIFFHDATHMAHFSNVLASFFFKISANIQIYAKNSLYVHDSTKDNDQIQRRCLERNCLLFES